MEIRNFKLDTEWNMIHYPNKPIGFGILVIGDERHFVDEKSSFWMQNEGKQALIEKLRDSGYTIFYSNLYGKNWGSEKAIDLAKRLYEFVTRAEILNNKIHIVAEGMGALVALRLMKEMEGNIRSVVLLNPVLSLKNHLEHEKEHKFFYNKLLQELASSFKTEINLVLEMVNNIQEVSIEDANVPVKIIHVLSGGRAYRQSTLLNQLSIKWEDEKTPISVCYLVPEKKGQIGTHMTNFFKQHEFVL